MDNLQPGDILTRIKDGSKWSFIHYPSAKGPSTVRTDYQGTDFPAKNKALIHVRRWDEDQADWDKNSHEAFPTTEFQKA